MFIVSQSDYTTAYMMTNGKNISAFLGWWWRGLSGVWKSSDARKHLVRVMPGGLEIVDKYNKTSIPLNTSDPDQLAKLAKRADYYLLVPGDKVITTAIPKTQRLKPLVNVAESLLPFRSEELHLASNPDNTEIFAVSKADTDAFLTELNQLGLPTKGIAFKDEAGLYYAEIAVNRAFKSRSRLLFNPLVSVLLLASVVTVTAIIGASAWQSETRLQAQLAARLQDINTQTSAAINAPGQSHQRPLTDRNLEQPRYDDFEVVSPRQASRILSTLQALLKSMPTGAEFNQIILSGNDLVIDGKATSATRLQSNIEQSEVFSATQFVTAISANDSDHTERFRLTTSLRDTASEQPGKPASRDKLNAPRWPDDE